MYTIHLFCDQIGRGLTAIDCRKADMLNAGLLEQVTDDLILWGGVDRADIERVLDYIDLEFSPSGVIGVFEEKYVGSYIKLDLICGVGRRCP